MTENINSSNFPYHLERKPEIRADLVDDIADCICHGCETLHGMTRAGALDIAEQIVFNLERKGWHGIKDDELKKIGQWVSDVDAGIFYPRKNNNGEIK